MEMSLRNRVISGVVGGCVLIFLLLLRGMFIVVSGTILAIIGVIEFNKAFKKKGYHPMALASIVMAIMMIGAFVYYSTHDLKGVVLVTIFTFNVLLTFYVFSDRDIVDIMITLFSVVYVVIPFILIMILSMRADMVIWLVFIMAFATDTFAFIIGRKYGTHKLIERVSPKKTIEGAIAGIFFCIISVVVFKFIAMPDMTLGSAVQLGLFGSIASQIGDLTASKIKRHCQLKDFGKLIPGHGGVLDRFDSILFTAPVVFVYVWIFFGV